MGVLSKGLKDLNLAFMGGVGPCIHIKTFLHSVASPFSFTLLGLHCSCDGRRADERLLPAACRKDALYILPFASCPSGKQGGFATEHEQLGVQVLRGNGWVSVCVEANTDEGRGATRREEEGEKHI